MEEDVTAVVRVRVRPGNLEDVADHLRRLLCGGRFSFVGHSPVDMNSISYLGELALDEGLGRNAVEVRVEQRGPLTVGTIVLHYDEGVRRGRPALEVLATSNREPDPSADDAELRIDQRPVVTIFDNLAVVRTENLVHEPSTAIFVRASEVDWSRVWRPPPGPSGANHAPSGGRPPNGGGR